MADNPYVFGRQLGDGVDGIVRLCIDTSSGQQFACKSVSKGNSDAVRHARAEILALERLRGHPNIVTFHGHFEDDSFIHILMEFCEGGNLCEYLQSRGPLPEHEASEVIAAILEALSFCHDRGIMHRDLKPENVILPFKDCPHSKIKLADFGTAADFSRRRVFSDAEGTPWYLAPEVLNGTGYDEKVDVWSLGVLLYILLSGYPPFSGESTSKIFQSIKRGKLDLKGEPWPSISTEAKDLIKGMLQRNTYRRMKVRDLLVHPWVRSFELAGKETARAVMEACDSVIVQG